MTEERCDHTFLPISHCGCKIHARLDLGGLTNHVGPRPAADAGARPPKDAILVHREGKAHWAGCYHLPSEKDISAPTWGWIPDRKLWKTIGTDQVQATGGNTALKARTRCRNCDG